MCNHHWRMFALATLSRSMLASCWKMLPSPCCLYPPFPRYPWRNNAAPCRHRALAPVRSTTEEPVVALYWQTREIIAVSWMRSLAKQLLGSLRVGQYKYLGSLDHVLLYETGHGSPPKSPWCSCQEIPDLRLQLHLYLCITYEHKAVICYISSNTVSDAVSQHLRAGKYYSR